MDGGDTTVGESPGQRRMGGRLGVLSLSAGNAPAETAQNHGFLQRFRLFRAPLSLNRVVKYHSPSTALCGRARCYRS